MMRLVSFTGIALGIVLSVLGFSVWEWQFWAAMLPVAIGAGLDARFA